MVSGMESETKIQLEMVWPSGPQPPAADSLLHRGYRLRLFRAGDEPAFFALMARAGWPGWDEERLAPWRPRIVPESWFLAEHEPSGVAAATAMGLDDPTDWHPSGGELGWVAADPDHRGRGLGLAVSAAVTARLLDAGYRDVHLYTEDFRLAALKTYLKLGYLPFVFAPDILPRWRRVCERLPWPYTPERWPRAAQAGP